MLSAGKFAGCPGKSTEKPVISRHLWDNRTVLALNRCLLNKLLISMYLLFLGNECMLA